ncbi:MAG: hypothetical protein EGR16_00030 [Clostridiales bacterium]|nr:hypothetical protein [Clostridiales bacterium]
MKKLTDEQIIKAADICRTGECSGCPYHELYTASCLNKLTKDVYHLLNRQKAEIESLKQIINERDKEILKLQKRIIFWRDDLNYQPEKIKSEAIKEFAERLKEKADDYVLAEGEFETMIFENDIDNLVKEMAKEMTEVQG